VIYAIRIVKNLLSALLLLILIYSCSKKNDDSITVANENTFSCKIDSVLFTPDVINAVLDSLSGIKITASDASGNKAVQLNMPIAIIPGTYAIGAGYSAQYNPNPSFSFVALNGTIVILSHDIKLKKLSGTFSFYGAPLTGSPPSVNITDGNFSVVTE
jgi:hypothetical protein